MHIKFKFLASIAIIASIFASCSNQDDAGVDNKSGAITFVSGLSKHATRISQDGSQWTAGDQIGIYMVQSGTTTLKDYINVPFAAESSAQVTVFKPTETNIFYPADESAVDFMAYYPYSNAIVNETYPINLANQSASLIAHDLMYAKADNSGKGFTSGSISFGFTHQLSKITLNLVDESNNPIIPDTDGLAIKRMNTTATFDLKTGSLSGAGTPANITLYKNDKSFEAILLPTTIAAGHEVSIMVDGNQYLWTMNNGYSGLEIKAGYSYTFKVTVKTSATEVEAVLVDFNGNSIAPWGDGGADNKVEEPTEDLDIPADFEKIELAAGSTVSGALASATSAKVAIMLADGGAYAETGGFNIPASITSLMIVGKGGTSMPSLYFGGSMTVAGNMDLIQLYNVELNGVYGGSYFINQSESVTIKQILIENCLIHDVRGVVRLQKNASTINSYKITNSIFYNINTYSILTVEAAGSAPNVEITKSTFYNLAGRGINLSGMDDAATITVDQCTFNQGPHYAIGQFKKDTGGSMIFTNNIVGLPYSADRGVSVSSNAGSTTASGNYYVSDTTWYGTAVGDDCGFKADVLFTDPANGNFTQSKLTAGDPRWY
ncbi:fimbrillin family protein [Bacteroides sp. 224]|uniref:fimbrillin family protein n=1 Tax=Bacteroides sp. 224 TaxID=2302936 RepID=UPI0013D074F4|nr:fimbrillin family protein [Bacteroides sp. 224]NDV67206.1 DUF4957 domain-containing protein [Bacteroides sp. 224]